MVKPSYRTDSLCLDQKGYQQALEDFAIAHLLKSLQTYSDADFDAALMNLTQSELESLAAILIRDLTANLNGKAIAINKHPSCSKSRQFWQCWLSHLESRVALVISFFKAWRSQL